MYQLIAESCARTEGLSNAHLRFMNVAKSKQADFSTDCEKDFFISYIT